MFSVPEGPSPTEINAAIEILRAAGAIPDADGLMTSEFHASGAATNTQSGTATVAVAGEVDSTVDFSAGVIGLASGASGNTAGVIGSAISPGGAGIRAANLNAGGGTDLLLEGGAQGETDASVTQSGINRSSGSPEKFTFENSGSGSLTVGVERLEALTDEAAEPAVFGVSTSDVAGSAGVRGIATANSGPTVGLWGTTVSPAGVGVLGDANNNSGTNYGVYGQTSSASGAGVFAANLDNTGGVDLVLDGTNQGLTNAALTESGIDRASASTEAFNIQNSGSGDLVLRVDGVDVVTSATDQDTLGGLGCANDQIAQVQSGNWTCQALPEGGGDPNGGIVHFPVWAFETNIFQDDDATPTEWRRSTSGYLYAASSPFAPPFVSTWGSPVTLPDGVTVTEMTVYYFDNDAVHNLEISASLRRRAPGLNVTTTMASISSLNSSGASGTIQSSTDLSVSSSSIDTSNTYYLTLSYETTNTGQDLRFYGVSIEYTAP